MNIRGMVQAIALTMTLALAALDYAQGALGDHDPSRQRTKRFDTDPHWDSHNNRVKVDKPVAVVQDFGYSLTHHAGGKAVGELGSRVQRSSTSAFYGRARATGVGPKWPKMRDINLIPNDGTPYQFDLICDPDANGSNGEVTFTLSGAGPFTGGPFTFKLPASHRTSGATFDSFWIINAKTARQCAQRVLRRPGDRRPTGIVRPRSLVARARQPRATR